MQLSKDIKSMNMTDKFQVLEQLWDDMSKNTEDERFTPDWHLDILKNREKNIQENNSQFNDINDVKKRLLEKRFV